MEFKNNKPIDIRQGYREPRRAELEKLLVEAAQIQKQIEFISAGMDGVSYQPQKDNMRAKINLLVKRQQEIHAEVEKLAQRFPRAGQ